MTTDYSSYEWYDEMTALLEDIESSQNGNNESSFDNSLFYSGTAYALTTLAGKLGVSTLGTNLAYYGLIFVGQLISESLERTGNDNLASYFGTDYGATVEFGDDWYDDAAEVVTNATLNTLYSIPSTFEPLLFLVDGNLDDFNDYLAYQSQSLFPFGNEEEFRLTPDSINGNTYTYKGNSRDNFLDLDYGYGTAFSTQKAYGYGGNDYIANADEAYGGDNGDYLADNDKAYGEDGDDFIINADEAEGGKGNDILINVDDGDGNEGDDYIIGTSGSNVPVRACMRACVCSAYTTNWIFGFFQFFA